MEDALYLSDNTKYYILRYKRHTYVIIDVDGAIPKSDLEKTLNYFVGQRLLHASKKEQLYNPYKAIDEFLDHISKQYNVFIIRDPVPIEVYKKLDEAISKYNEKILSS